MKVEFLVLPGGVPIDISGIALGSTPEVDRMHVPSATDTESQIIIRGPNIRIRRRGRALGPFREELGVVAVTSQKLNGKRFKNNDRGFVPASVTIPFIILHRRKDSSNVVDLSIDSESAGN